MATTHPSNSGAANGNGARGNGHRRDWVGGPCNCPCRCPRRTLAPPSETHRVCHSCRRSHHDQLHTNIAANNNNDDDNPGDAGQDEAPVSTNLQAPASQIRTQAQTAAPIFTRFGMTRQVNYTTPEVARLTGTVDPLAVHYSMEGLLLPSPEWIYPGVLDHTMGPCRGAEPEQDESCDMNDGSDGDDNMDEGDDGKPNDGDTDSDSVMVDDTGENEVVEGCYEIEDDFRTETNSQTDEEEDTRDDCNQSDDDEEDEDWNEGNDL